MKAIIFVLVLMAMLLAGPATAKGPLVLAPSSLQNVMDAAADAWTAEGHDRPTLSYAGTSALARQVLAGAEADLFISADSDWMDRAARRGRLVSGTRHIIARNRLVVVRNAAAAGPERLPHGRALIAALGTDGRLAIADPAGVPAGRYAESGLKSLGVWDEAQGRLVRAENVRAALALVERGAVPFGIVYATDARSSLGVRRIASFSAASHPPIVYPAAILRTSKHRDARPFLAWLRSGAGPALFRAHGFMTPAG